MIRKATVEDLQTVEPLAREFYASSKALYQFKLNKFCTLWKSLIENDTGVIFMAFDDEKFIGAIGGVCYPDAYSEDMIATEFFWYITPAKRGRGMALYEKYEEWARSKNCNRIRMAHLCDLMPDALRWLYTELGYRPVEVTYEKELN